MPRPGLVVSRLLPAFACLLPALDAQCTGFSSQVVRSGNVSFRQLDLPTVFVPGGGGADFTADAPNQADVLGQLSHYYRIAGDTAETPFRDTPVQCLNVTHAADKVTFDWPNVDNTNLLRARLELQVGSLGADAGCLTATMTLTNRSGSPLRLDYFVHADVDLCTAAANTASPVQGDPTWQAVLASGCSSRTAVEVRGLGADRWETAVAPTLRNRLVDGAVTNLGNTGLPFGPGDYSVALQWQDRILAAGTSQTFVTTLCHNRDTCRTAASSFGYGNALAGTHGVPTLTTTRLPVLGDAGELAIATTPPYSTGVLVVGLARRNQPIGHATLLVDPVAQALVATDATGAGTHAQSLPLTQSLCGAQVLFQYLFVDPIVPGPLPLAHTAGVEWTLGR